MVDVAWVRRYLDHARDERAVAQRSLEMMRAGEMRTYSGRTDTTAQSIEWTEQMILSRDELIEIYEADLAAGRFG